VKTPQVIEALGALAHGHRLKVYRLLVELGPQGLPAGAIASRVGLLPSSLTFHLQALHRAGLVLQRREGRQLFYSADFEAMNALVGYLTENCCAGSGEACTSACKPSAAPKAAPKTTQRSRAA
jgi:ArsR family transcriptional regulator, arsenate/arsenite/antimonite-responsive transcriptional repressor